MENGFEVVRDGGVVGIDSHERRHVVPPLAADRRIGTLRPFRLVL